MISLRHYCIRRIVILWTVSLLLLPLLFSGHRHAASPSSTSDTCALCVVTHLSPAMTAPPLPQLAPSVATRTQATRIVAPLASRLQPRPSGRAPPSPQFFGAV
jgi:hypothetical protein